MTLATETGGIGVWEFDVRKGALIWDPWMHRLYGLAPRTETKTYDTWARHVHPDDRVAAEQLLRDALAGDHEFRTEFRVVWDDGSVHHLRTAARITRDESGVAQRMTGVSWDVTSLRHLAEELSDQHELLRVTLQSIGDAVITTDAAGRVTWLNPVAERMTGWHEADAAGVPVTEVFRVVNGSTRREAENPVAACLLRDAMRSPAEQTVLISRDGCEFGIEDSAAPIRNARGEVLGVVLVFHDVTEQRRLSGEMNHRATHDALTGLVNRAEFESRLLRILNQSHGVGTQNTLLFIDLDQFKMVNDSCGHSVGDQLLQQVAKLLTAAVRTGDTVARLGGDEFAVVLAHCATDQAQRVAQQICDHLEDYRFSHEERRFRIGASIGLVPLDHRWAAPSAAMQAADTACYAAKDAGRNRVHTWLDTDQSLRARNREIEWAASIEEALDKNQFVLYAQRIESLTADGGGLRAEVLIRLQRENGELVPPGAFLPAAERFHLATRVDRWVLQQVLDTLAVLPDVTRVEMLCVNLSGQSVGDRAFHRHAIAALRAAGSSLCSRLCLEITETAAVTNMADAAVFIDQARSLGVRVALDDFGAGASSFGYLKTLKVDLLKIDGQFIRNLIEDQLDDAAVRCFVDVARVVGVRTVAEFVDRTAVLDQVRKLGIDFAQGFLLHRPEPIATLLDRVIRRPATADALNHGAAV